MRLDFFLKVARLLKIHLGPMGCSFCLSLSFPANGESLHQRLENLFTAPLKSLQGRLAKERDSGEVLLFTKGKYKGLEVDDDIGKNIRNLSVTEKHYQFSNFFYKGAYWKAQVPRTPTKMSYVVAPTADEEYNHVGVAFHFLNPVTLIDQNGKKEFVYEVLTDGIARGPRGFDWNLRDTLVGNYVLMNRLTSLETYIEEAHSKGKTVCLYEIVYDQVKSEGSLARALERSNSSTMNKRFNTLYRNCGTEMSHVLGADVPGLSDSRSFFQDPVSWLESSIEFEDLNNPNCFEVPSTKHEI